MTKRDVLSLFIVAAFILVAVITVTFAFRL